MSPKFPLFGLAHLSILCAVPALAFALAFIHNRFPASAKTVRLSLAFAILLDTSGFYIYQFEHQRLRFPHGLPLELCDASMFLVIFFLFTLRPLLFDLAYFWALAGASMALLTPDVLYPFPSFGYVQYFIAHGLTVAATLYILWSRQARPRPWSVARAMIGVNAFAAVVGPFDYFFRTNYFYLRAKPANPSLLDILGPWPFYIISTEAVGLALFLLLYLPVCSSNAPAAHESEVVSCINH
jgi:hypothetical integral membrane protein (TIGR02206 family)